VRVDRSLRPYRFLRLVLQQSPLQQIQAARAGLRGDGEQPPHPGSARRSRTAPGSALCRRCARWLQRADSWRSDRTWAGLLAASLGQASIRTRARFTSDNPAAWKLGFAWRSASLPAPYGPDDVDVDQWQPASLDIVVISPVAGAPDDIGLLARQSAFWAPLRVAQRRPEATQPRHGARKPLQFRSRRWGHFRCLSQFLSTEPLAKPTGADAGISFLSCNRG
jgi:hypothetical protein